MTDKEGYCSTALTEAALRRYRLVHLNYKSKIPYKMTVFRRKIISKKDLLVK
jgi:hypothetical protein